MAAGNNINTARRNIRMNRGNDRLLGAAIAAIVLACLTHVALAAPEIPGAPQAKPIAIVGGTIHPVSGPAIVGGTLIFADGKITAVAKSAPIPAGAETLDAKGKHVYPGLFDAYSDMGLIEVNSIRGSVDVHETGLINPNVKAQVAVNPDSEIIPVTRSNGVLLALTAPTGGLLAGKSAVLQLDGWTWEDMTLRGDVAMHVEWPAMSPSADWSTEESAKEQMAARDKALAELKKAFEHARAYAAARKADPAMEKHPLDLRWEAMQPVLRGELPLIVTADEIQQIQAAVAFASAENLKLILYGGYDAPACAELLKQHNVPVIVAGVYRLPMRASDAYDAAYTLPARLRDAGLRFCVSGSGRFGASNVRNLPYHAATAAAFGLTPDEALKSITLWPAEILGVSDRVGSLQVGKDATLFLADGDPLEAPTQIESAFIQGRRVELSDRHKRLWKKYEEKYRRERETAAP